LAGSTANRQAERVKRAAADMNGRKTTIAIRPPGAAPAACRGSGCGDLVAEDGVVVESFDAPARSRALGSHCRPKMSSARVLRLRH
jgi:hypothetical protein